MESVWLAGECADGAEVDNVTRELGIHGLFDIGADLHVVAATGRAELFHAGNFICETDATRTLDAAIHGGFHEGAEVLVLHGSLAGYFVEASAVRTVAHGLILKVAFATLVTNGAV